MRRQSFRVTWRNALVHGIIGIVAALLFWFAGLLYGLEGKTYDLRASLLAGRSSFSDSIMLVVVDQESLDWVAENMGVGWPWPRELFAAVIKNCVRRGAESIGFDVLFTEPSNVAVTDDLQLKNAMLQAGYFTLGSVVPSNVTGKSETWPEAIPKPDYPVQFLNTSHLSLPTYTRATFPVPDLLTYGIVLANVQHHADDDGIYRKMHPFVQFDNSQLPTLGAGVYLAAHPGATITVSRYRIVVDGHVIPVDKNGYALINYRKPGETYRSITAGSVIRQEFQFLNNEIGPEAIKDDLSGKYVLFGYTAPGLRELRPSPTDGASSGIEINANFLDNMLAEDFIRPVNTVQTVFRLVLLTLTATFLLSIFQSQKAQVIAAVILPIVPVGLALLLYLCGYDFKLVPIELSVITATSSSIIHRYMVVGKKERFIRHSFRHYLSPVVIDQLIEYPEKLKLGGERKELSVFFSDLEGFTSISEGIGPEELTHLLNDYLTEMTNIILDEKGTVDKFEGDAIIAFWNAPLDVDNHAERAVRAALRCQERLARIRPEFLEEYGKNLNMRIGINTGPAVVGNMGSSTRFDYTVLGDAVNLAARLEGANKQFGTYTMISETTHCRLGPQFSCRELARIRVVGRREPIKVYEPLAYSPDAGKEKDFQSFARGLQLFYDGRLNEACEEFGKTAGQDNAARMYAQKCEKILERVPDAWEGVWEADSK